MSLYIIIRKSITAGFLPTNTNNPSEKELLNDLITYTQVFLFQSIDDAKKVAELFDHSPKPPKVGGSYGLVAEVKVEFADIPKTSEVDAAQVFNTWVDSQKLGYSKKENTGELFQCLAVTPTQIKSITQKPVHLSDI